jgi:Cytochrome C1 family
MVRPIGILAGLGFVGVLLWSLMWGVIAYVSEPPKETAEHAFHLHPKEVSYSFQGPMGTYDRAQLQRGFQVYKEVCSACHSLKYVAFRDLEQLGFSKCRRSIRQPVNPRHARHFLRTASRSFLRMTLRRVRQTTMRSRPIFR